MDINQFIQKTPRPILVLTVLIVGIAIYMFNDPLRDECDIQISNFEKATKGLLTNAKTKSKKTQFSKLDYWSSRCKEGNSIGSCNEYFEGLRAISNELRLVKESCQAKYGADNIKFLKQLEQGLQIMALVAWGEKPPAGAVERFGWLNESHIRTFCYLKKTFLLLYDEPSLLLLREKVYKEYPGPWPEKFNVDQLVLSNTDAGGAEKNDMDIEKLVDENRPRAYRTIANPQGVFTKDEIFERSLFSIRCDSYM